MPSVKSGKWDGKIRFFNVRSRLFPVGLLSHLVKWAKKNGYYVSVADKEKFRPLDNGWKEYTENLDSQSKFVPRDVQRKAVREALSRNKCLIVSPTGSGKSLIAYLLVKFFLEKTEGNILITVPTVGLVEQLYKDFISYSTGDVVVEKLACKIMAGEKKDNSKRIVISTWQSIYKLHPSWFASFDSYICDEAHLAEAKCLSGLADKLGHAKYIIGMTGSVKKQDENHLMEMQARFGVKCVAAETHELQAKGELAAIKIRCPKLSYSQKDRVAVKKMDYQTEVLFLVKNKQRNEFLVSEALRSKGNTLLLFHYVQKHGDVLHEMLLSRSKSHGKKIYYIHGAVDVDTREQIRHFMEIEDNCILLASFGTLSTGINIKNIHNIIFGHPYKAEIKTIQSIGRGLRTLYGKTLILVDPCDDIAFTQKNGQKKYNHAMKHFIERLKIYEDQKFEYKIENNTCF